MEVKVIPISGCVMVILGIFTLGIAPIAQFIILRSWPKQVDEQGLVTRGGKRIAWSEFTKIKRVLTQVVKGSTARTEHFELYSSKGKVIVAPYRLVDGNRVWAMIWEKLPEQCKSNEK